MQVTVPKPDVKGRTEILNWYLKKIKVDPGGFSLTVFRMEPEVASRGSRHWEQLDIVGCRLMSRLYSAAIEANVIARGTVGFSGADLENLVNQAALKAAVDGKDMVSMKELEFAKDKILMGERRSSFVSYRSPFTFGTFAQSAALLFCLKVLRGGVQK